MSVAGRALFSVGLTVWGSACATGPSAPTTLRTAKETAAAAQAAPSGQNSAALLAPPAVSPAWSPHLGYLQRMIEAVQTRWEKLLSENKTYPKVGSQVTAVFALNAKGEIARIVSVEGTAGDLGMRAAVSAITGASSYGVWTEAMKTELGEEQQMTFTFIYQ